MENVQNPPQVVVLISVFLYLSNGYGKQLNNNHPLRKPHKQRVFARTRTPGVSDAGKDPQKK